MEFEPDFFKEEERYGFVVSEKMKRAWAAELEMLAEIIRICKKHDITYYANFGTLLGAVRHGGYVPWDDDIDIELKWEDYERLLAVLPKELPEGWRVYSAYTSDHNQPFSCVANSTHISTAPEFLERFHGCPYIVGLDIFPLTYIPRDAELAEMQRSLYLIVYGTVHDYTEKEKSGELEGCLAHIEELCNIRLDRSKPIRKQLWTLADQISAMFTEEESDEMTGLWYMVTKNASYRLKKEWYADTVELPFENIRVNAPVGYHEILTKLYGDYMTPKRDISSHDYPFYKKQDEYLQRLGR